MGQACENLLFVDCQTSGLSATQSEILELGWAFSSDPEAIHTALIRPKQLESIPPKVWKILGLGPADFEGAHAGVAVWKRVVEEGRARGVSALVVHYASFESGFLRALHSEAFSEDGLPWPVICTYRLAGKLCADLPSRTIRALSGYLGHVLPPTQRSRDHVAATQRIWQFLQKEAPKPEPLVPQEVRRSLPLGPGVYEMRSEDGTLLYIGKATSLKARVASYFQKRKGDRRRLPELMTQVRGIQVIETATPLEAALLETDRIKAFEPHYNTALRKNDRRVLFFNWDLETFSEHRTEKHPLGPFLDEESFESVGILMRLLNDAATPLDEHILAHPAEAIRPLLEKVLHELGVADDEDVTAYRLLVLGKKLPAPEKESDEETPEGVAVEPSPEAIEAEIRSSILRKLRRPGRALHRARWRVRMGNCRAAWRLGDGENASWRYLVMEGGQVKERGTVESLEALPPYRRATGAGTSEVSVEDYDRLRVLATELSSLAKRVPVRVEFSATRSLSNESSSWLSRVAWQEERVH